MGFARRNAFVRVMLVRVGRRRVGGRRGLFGCGLGQRSLGFVRVALRVLGAMLGMVIVTTVVVVVPRVRAAHVQEAAHAERGDEQHGQAGLVGRTARVSVTAVCVSVLSVCVSVVVLGAHDFAFWLPWDFWWRSRAA